MQYLAGLVLCLATLGMTTVTGLGRERSFYSTVMIVVASYYVLFAVMSGSTAAIASELLVGSLFLAVAVLGFRSNLWWVAAALVAHGMLDLVHHRVIDNPGVPPWWPGFCLAFDVTAGGFLALLLSRRRVACTGRSGA